MPLEVVFNFLFWHCCRFTGCHQEIYRAALCTHPQPPPMLTLCMELWYTIKTKKEKKMSSVQSTELIQVSPSIHTLKCVCGELHAVSSHVQFWVTTIIKISNGTITRPLMLPSGARTPFLLAPSPTTQLSSKSIIMLFHECYINGNMQHIAFQNWLCFTQHKFLEVHPSTCMYW